MTTGQIARRIIAQRARYFDSRCTDREAFRVWAAASRDYRSTVGHDHPQGHRLPAY